MGGKRRPLHAGCVIEVKPGLFFHHFKEESVVVVDVRSACTRLSVADVLPAMRRIVPYYPCATCTWRPD